jgi:hypothetical protein
VETARPAGGAPASGKQTAAEINRVRGCGDVEESTDQVPALTGT